MINEQFINFQETIQQKMKKQKYHHHSTYHSLSPSPHQSHKTTFSTQNIANKPNYIQTEQFDSEIYEFNFKVLSRQPALRNIDKILFTLNFVNLAKYQINGDYWSYLKVKGPMFVIIDRYSQIKFAVLNQCSTENQIIHIQKQMKFQLKNLAEDGFMLNYCIEDSITGKSIYGIWTADKNIEKIWHHLQNYLKSTDQDFDKSPIKN